uniref:Protein kinase domain-containing protein n=1 Tax=Heligmosomoides polygyrus TaxID=6339 RepID=A0A8L8Q6Z1_HELPZ
LEDVGVQLLCLLVHQMNYALGLSIQLRLRYRQTTGSIPVQQYFLSVSSNVLSEDVLKTSCHVSDITASKHTTYALKTERVNSPTKVLKMEVVVLRALKNARATHCCDILDSGRALGYNFIIMTLVGASLMDLRKNNKVKHNAFTMGCAISVGIQTLESIQELHNVGFLHRDLKPANFAICLNDGRKIYLLDFGMCRRYIDNENAVRKPRWASGFRGTQRYAAISCHISREMARKDDLESWLYQQVLLRCPFPIMTMRKLQIELTSGELPWKSLEDTVAICNAKEKSRTTGLTQLFAGCPKEYIHIMFYIDSLRYYDKPHYAVIRGLLRDALTSNALSEFPYDWEVDQNKQTASTPPGELKWNMWLGWTASSIMKENQLSEEDPLRN